MGSVTDWSARCRAIGCGAENHQEAHGELPCRQGCPQLTTYWSERNGPDRTPGCQPGRTPERQNKTTNTFCANFALTTVPQPLQLQPTAENARSSTYVCNFGVCEESAVAKPRERSFTFADKHRPLAFTCKPRCHVVQCRAGRVWTLGARPSAPPILRDPATSVTVLIRRPSSPEPRLSCGPPVLRCGVQVPTIQRLGASQDGGRI